MKINAIQPNPENPRVIKDGKFKKGDILTCQHCGEAFVLDKARNDRVPKFCSRACSGERLKAHMDCKICGKEIENKHSVAIHNRVYCSRACSGKDRQNKPLPEKWKMALSIGRKKSSKCKGEKLYNWKGGKETEPQRMKFHNLKRRTSLKIEIDPVFIKALQIAQGNRCYYCEQPFVEKFQIEHLTPVSKGGDNQPYNLVLACKNCNSHKRAKTMENYSILMGINWIDKWDHIYTSALIIKDRIHAGKIPT